MHTLSATTSVLTQSVAWALLFSLWQGLLIFGLLFVLLKALPNMNARVKYYASLMACTALFVWFAATCVVQYEKQKTVTIHYIATPTTSAATAASTTYTVEKISTSPAPRPLPARLMPQVEEYFPLLMILYTIGLTFMLCRLLINILQLGRLRKQGLTAPELHWTDLLVQLQEQFGITRRVQLFLSERIDVPMMLGTLKPIILLPIATMNHLSTEQVEAILLHELAHIKRYDYLLNIFQTIVETILFFNPFVWLISRITRREREHCCDDLVVARSESPLPYAKALAILESCRRSDNNLTLAASGQKNQLLHRIQRIMEMKKNNSSYSRLTVTLLAIVVISCSIALLSPSFAQKAKKKETTSNSHVTPWPPIKESDIEWKKRVWRDVDLTRNNFFGNNAQDNGLINTLIEGVSSGKIIAYQPGDNSFSKEESIDEFEGVVSHINTHNINTFRIKEDWIFLKKSNQMIVRIVGIAPLKMSTHMDGTRNTGAPLFWIYYPSCRDYLAQHQVNVPGEDDFVTHYNWEEFFESRMFDDTLKRNTHIAAAPKTRDERSDEDDDNSAPIASKWYNHDDPDSIEVRIMTTDGARLYALLYGDPAGTHKVIKEININANSESTDWEEAKSKLTMAIAAAYKKQNNPQPLNEIQRQVDDCIGKQMAFRKQMADNYNHKPSLVGHTSDADYPDDELEIVIRTKSGIKAHALLYKDPVRRKKMIRDFAMETNKDDRYLDHERDELAAAIGEAYKKMGNPQPLKKIEIELCRPVPRKMKFEVYERTRTASEDEEPDSREQENGNINYTQITRDSTGRQKIVTVYTNTQKDDEEVRKDDRYQMTKDFEQMAKDLRNMARDLTDAHVELNTINWQAIKDQLRKNLAELDNEFSDSKMHREINVELRRAMDKSRETIEEAEKEVERARNYHISVEETRKAQREVEEVQREVEEARREVALAKKESRQASKEVEQAKRESRQASKEVEQAKKESEKAQNLHKKKLAVTEKMGKDGLLDPSGEYRIKKTKDELFINGVKQPQDVFDKYGGEFEDNSEFEVSHKNPWGK